MNRAERRRIARAKKSFGAWKAEKSPKELGVGDGWFGELDRVWSNGKYAVMARTVLTEWGTVDHVCIRNTGNTDIPWREKQKIKNELFGVERTAIEVFPAEINLVDEAGMYHIWVLPEDMKLPFGLERIT